MNKLDETRAAVLNAAEDYGRMPPGPFGDIRAALSAFETAVLGMVAAAIWQAIRDGSNIDELPDIFDLVCPDCEGNLGGYYVGEHFEPYECELCGRVGSE